jgi:hypothetical protein
MTPAKPPTDMPWLREPWWARAEAAWNRFWFDPQPAHRIALFRIFAPLAILGLMSSRIWNWQEFLTHAGFHVPEFQTATPDQPIYFAPIGVDTAFVITLLLVASGLAVSLGWHTRIANVIFAALLAYVSLFDRLCAVSVNKLGTTVMVALCFCQSGAVYSLDARRRRRTERNYKPTTEIPGGPIRFLMVQLAVMYCASGLCKAGANPAEPGDWLKSGYVLWSQIHGHYQTVVSYWVGRLLPQHAWPVLQALVLTYELGAPLLLVWRRSRNATIGFGFAMHLMVGLMFRRIIYFSLLMMSLLTLWLPDRAQLTVLWLPRRLPFVGGRRKETAPLATTASGGNAGVS